MKGTFFKPRIFRCILKRDQLADRQRVGGSLIIAATCHLVTLSPCHLVTCLIVAVSGGGVKEVGAARQGNRI